MNRINLDEFIEVTDESLSDFIKTHEKCVLLCWKEKCPYCRQFFPIVSSVSHELKNITFAQINIDKNKKAAKNLNVRTVPTIIVFYQRSVKKGIIGMKSKFAIKNDIRLAFATAYF